MQQPGMTQLDYTTNRFRVRISCKSTGSRAKDGGRPVRATGDEHRVGQQGSRCVPQQAAAAADNHMAMGAIIIIYCSRMAVGSNPARSPRIDGDSTLHTFRFGLSLFPRPYILHMHACTVLVVE